MSRPDPAGDIVARHYAALVRKDFMPWADTMANIVVRRGPYFGDQDTVTSKAEHVDFSVAAMQKYCGHWVVIPNMMVLLLSG